jgi:hypothetical protein
MLFPLGQFHRGSVVKVRCPRPGEKDAGHHRGQVVACRQSDCRKQAKNEVLKAAEKARDEVRKPNWVPKWSQRIGDAIRWGHRIRGIEVGVR